MLAEVRSSIQHKVTFALESTLSGKTYVRLMKDARNHGFRIHLHYLWLSDVAIAIARVRERVRKGGHGIPVADIKRRFDRSLRYLITDYGLLANRWAVWDNDNIPPVLLAESETCTLAELKAILEDRERQKTTRWH